MAMLWLAWRFRNHVSARRADLAAVLLDKHTTDEVGLKGHPNPPILSYFLPGRLCLAVDGHLQGSTPPPIP